MEWRGVDWNSLCQDMVQSVSVFVNTMTKIRIVYKSGISCPPEGLSACQHGSNSTVTLLTDLSLPAIRCSCAICVKFVFVWMDPESISIENWDQGSCTTSLKLRIEKWDLFPAVRISSNSMKYLRYGHIQIDYGWQGKPVAWIKDWHSSVCSQLLLKRTEWRVYIIGIRDSYSGRCRVQISADRLVVLSKFFWKLYLVPQDKYRILNVP
jgi:hypothetical protein